MASPLSETASIPALQCAAFRQREARARAIHAAAFHRKRRGHAPEPALEDDAVVLVTNNFGSLWLFLLRRGGSTASCAFKRTDRLLAEFLPAPLVLQSHCTKFFSPRLLLLGQLEICLLGFVPDPLKLLAQFVQAFVQRIRQTIFLRHLFASLQHEPPAGN